MATTARHTPVLDALLQTLYACEGGSVQQWLVALIIIEIRDLPQLLAGLDARLVKAHRARDSNARIKALKRWLMEVVPGMQFVWPTAVPTWHAAASRLGLDFTTNDW
jgi:hypothetical protein